MNAVRVPLTSTTRIVSANAKALPLGFSFCSKSRYSFILLIFFKSWSSGLHFFSSLIAFFSRSSISYNISGWSVPISLQLDNFFRYLNCLQEWIGHDNRWVIAPDVSLYCWNYTGEFVYLSGCRPNLRLHTVCTLNVACLKIITRFFIETVCFFVSSYGLTSSAILASRTLTIS